MLIMKVNFMLYDPKTIRTQNMPSFRASDRSFDPNLESVDSLGVVSYPQRSLTQQQFVDECDINKIVANADRTGLLSHANHATPRYGDFSQFGDALHFQSSLNTVVAAENAFMSLPAEVRKRFGNDPIELLSFLDDPKNRDEAVRLGFLNPPSPPSPSDTSSMPSTTTSRSSTSTSSSRSSKPSKTTVEEVLE